MESEKSENSSSESLLKQSPETNQEEEIISFPEHLFHEGFQRHFSSLNSTTKMKNFRSCFWSSRTTNWSSFKNFNSSMWCKKCLIHLCLKTKYSKGKRTRKWWSHIILCSQRPHYSFIHFIFYFCVNSFIFYLILCRYF